jgi:hypothetical protein
MSVKFGHSWGTWAVFAAAVIVPPVAHADLEAFKSALLFTNNTTQNVNDLELFIQNGKFTGITGAGVTVNPVLPSVHATITGFNLAPPPPKPAKPNTLSLNVTFSDFNGMGFTAKWTNNSNFAGNIATVSTSVGVQDLGGGILDPNVTVANDFSGETLTFEGGYFWVPSFFDVFVDPLPALLPLPNETLNPGDSFDFTGLNTGNVGEDLLVVATLTNSQGNVESSFATEFAVPEPSAIVLFTSALLVIGLALRTGRRAAAFPPVS